VALAERTVVGEAQVNVRVLGETLTAVGGSRSVLMVKLCVPLQPLTVLVTITEYVVVTVGFTTTEEELAPVLQLYTNEPAGEGAVMIVPLGVLQFIVVLLAAPLTDTGLLFAATTYDTELLQLLLRSVTSRL
jgi:hypothetical protein